MGAHGRVVGNFVRAGTRRFCGAAWDNGRVCSVATGQPPLSDRLRLPLSAPAEQIAYAFPSAASSRSRRPAAQIALVPFSCVAFSPSAVFTFTVASSTAYDPRTTRPLNTVVISLQIIGVATAAPPPRSLIEAAPGVHADEARRIAANIAKLPNLLRSA